MNIKNPEEIGNKSIKITIQVEDEVHIYEGVNIFGGVIEEYTKGQPFTMVKPFAVGNFTPGMLLSYISGLVAHAMESSLNLGIPTSLVKEMAILAVHEGAAGGKKKSVQN